jgi:phosphoribosylformimino-5-aminoimidazole carboxamide ribotide isomerase
MRPFLIIPAIDLMAGCVVRLKQGRAEDRTQYSDDPAQVARSFEAAGARRIHIVDLDGAFRGASANLAAIREIRRAVGCEIEVGGGFRTPEAVRGALAEGIDYVILGTLAVEQPDLLAAMVREHGERLIVAVDARDGRVATRGWVEGAESIPVIDLARQMVDLGIKTFLYTDIARDGMLTGPNVPATRDLAHAVPAADVIASGGVSRLQDLRDLAALALPNLLGAITGRALYDGRIDLAEAIRSISK